MPVGQQPTPPASGAVFVENTQSLKVYYKLSPTASWEIDRSLICIGHSKTKGSKIGSAQFTVLMDTNDETDTSWIRTNLVMRHSAARQYNVDMSDGYKTPYLVMVTDVYGGVEKSVWQGYISSVDQDFVRERCSVTGLSFTGMLDQQQIFGGWYITTKLEVGFYRQTNYFYDYAPVYNPKGVGNKSVYYRLPEGSYRAHAIDSRLTKTVLFATSLWTVKDMLFQVFARCTDPVFDGTDGGGLTDINWWIWAKDVYRVLKPFDISKVDGDGGPLDDSSTLNDYSLQGKSIWEAIVELVESVDGLTVTEEIDTTSADPKEHRPYISIVNLKGGE